MVRLSRHAISVFTLGLLLALPGAAGAADHWGEPDPTFGSAGLVFPDKLDHSTDVVVQPDGKILVAGGGWNYATIVRLLPSGAPDTDFGVDGAFEMPVAAGTHSSFTDIELQPGGKIIAVGGASTGSTTITTKGLIARLNPKGTLDSDADSTPGTSFGEDASGFSVFQDGTTRTVFSSVSLHAADEIIVGGVAGGESEKDLEVRKFDGDGTPDAAFDANAADALVDSHPVNNDYPTVIRAADGKVSLLFLDSGGQEIHVQRLEADGDVDAAFHTDGLLILSFDLAASLSSAILTSDGGILALGGLFDWSDNTAIGFAFRLGADGEIDESFGSEGLAFVNGLPWAEWNLASSAAELPGGGFAVFGRSSTVGYGESNVNLLRDDGSYDESFGDYGSAYLQEWSSSGSEGIAVQSDGRIVASDTGQYPSTLDVFVERLRTPSPDPKPTPTPTPPERHFNPGASISTPSGSRLSASKKKIAAGSASPKGRISRVAIAVQRVDAKALKKKGKCLWLKSRDAKFKSVRAANGACDSPVWLSALGTDNWSYTLKNKLPKGTYILSVRATADDGTRQALPTTKRFKVR